MIGLNATLNNLIAMVVVLLALSLVVQAVQASIKKGFKLKSRQIEDSLAHLFQFVLDNETNSQTTAPDATGSTTDQTTAVAPKVSPTEMWASKWKGIKAVCAQSPLLRVFLRFLYHPAADPKYPHAGKLYNEVLNKFRGLGRTAFSTRPMFDSLAKNDLLKVVASIEPSKIDNAFGENVGVALGEFNNCLSKFQEWTSWIGGQDFQTANTFLSPDDKATIAGLQGKFKPLMDDLGTLLTSTVNPGQIVESIARDIAALRGIDLVGAQSTIDDVRSRIVQKATEASTNNQPDVAATLNKTADQLKAFSDEFKVFRQKYDGVFAHWVKLEQSFDAVMQGFEERYTRSMKTAAILISFAVVVFLNANFFKVYQQISTSDTKRALILETREDVIKALNKPNADTNDQAVAKTVDAWFTASKNQIDQNASVFIGYGFAPITLQQTMSWLSSLIPKKNATTDQRDFGGWWEHRKHDVQVLIGWSVMALLLSVGAPFWQDALESLFGVKNLLRKSSDTRNVEDTGGGQTRS